MSRAPSPDKRPGWAWSEYWRSGRTDVMIVDGAKGSAPFDTDSFWRTFFEAFANDARLLDLATGGGHVARIASAVAHQMGRSFEIVGVDHADLGPSAGPSSDGFRLMGGVALEKLPFETGYFDAASSQFGLEYADTRAALQELSRVLKPGGRALFLVHHADSVVSRWATEQVAAFDRVAGEGSAMRQARRAFTAAQRRLAPAARRSAEDGFRDAVQRAASRLQPEPAFAHAATLVEYLEDLVRGLARYEPVSALARLDDVEAANAAWRQRQRSQIVAALDTAGIDGLIQRAARAGLTCARRAEEQDPSGDIVGWRLDLFKA